MKAAQIYIRNTESYLDVKQDGDFPFVLSKSVAEIQDVQKRNKNYSKTFKVAATPANIQALGYPHVLGTDLDAINVYKQSAYVIVNGNVIDEGYIYIMKAVREIEVIEFECQFVGSNEAWVVGLQNIRMNQIFQDSAGSGLEVAYTDNDIIARSTPDPRTMLDPSYVYINPYMYQFCDGEATNYNNDSFETYQGDSRAAVYTDFWPAFRVDYLVDAIFGTANGPLIKDYLATQGITFDAFQLDSDFLTDNATHGFWDNIYYSDRSEESYSTTFGASNFWGLFLPSQMTALDFFMKLVKTFNLVFDFDGITLKVEPRLDWTSWDGNTYDGFYGGTSVDWSNKIAKEQAIEYRTTNYKRQVRISYGTDDYPFTPSMYPFYTDDKVNQPEVRYTIDLNNNLEEGITDIKLPFNTSPSKFYQGKFDYARTRYPIAGGISSDQEREILANSDSITFNPNPAYVDRLFVFKSGTPPMGIMYYGDSGGSISKGQAYLYRPTWRKWIYERQDGTTFTHSAYPFVYNCMTIDPYNHRNKSIFVSGGSSLTYDVVYQESPDFDAIENVDVSDVSIIRTALVNFSFGAVTDIESNDIDDINLGIYASNSVNMVDGLYERFWKSTLDHLVTTKTLVTKVRLTRNEFVTLDMSAYYTALGQRFILNAVKDYDPTLDEQMVEVELLSVDFVRASELTAPPAATLLLDLYGEDCDAAYSVRKLRTAYTGAAFSVRRSSDDTEQDIGFDSDGNLDESALTTFVGAGSGYIVTWYDQTTNGNDATQLTTTRQMRVVTLGTVEKIGTKVAPNAYATRTFYVPSTVIAVTPPQTTIGLIKPDATSGNFHFMGENLSGTYRFGGHDNRLFLNGGSLISTPDGAIAQSHMIAVGLCNGASSVIRANGSQEATGNTSGNSYSINAIFGAYNSSSNMRGHMQEILIYTADKSSDIDNIESDINTYFEVYS